MEIEGIAQVAHELNRALCQAFGDNSQPTWQDAPQWQKDSAINGVKFHIKNPNARPSDSHNAWLAFKYAEGWTYGEVKDEKAKTHPCCVPYEKLPDSQKSKDYVFCQAVHSLEKYL